MHRQRERERGWRHRGGGGICEERSGRSRACWGEGRVDVEQRPQPYLYIRGGHSHMPTGDTPPI